MRIRIPAISMQHRGVAEERERRERTWPRDRSVMPTRTVPERGLVYDRRVPNRPLHLERIVALVPVRGLEGAKARLGEALDAEERRALVERLLARTVAAAAATPAVAEVVVISADPEVLALAAHAGRPRRRPGGRRAERGTRRRSRLGGRGRRRRHPGGPRRPAGRHARRS